MNRLLKVIGLSLTAGYAALANANASFTVVGHHTNDNARVSGNGYGGQYGGYFDHFFHATPGVNKMLSLNAEGDLADVHDPAASGLGSASEFSTTTLTSNEYSVTAATTAASDFVVGPTNDDYYALAEGNVMDSLEFEVTQPGLFRFSESMTVLGSHMDGSGVVWIASDRISPDGSTDIWKIICPNSPAFYSSSISQDLYLPDGKYQFVVESASESIISKTGSSNVNTQGIYYSNVTGSFETVVPGPGAACVFVCCLLRRRRVKEI